MVNLLDLLKDILRNMATPDTIFPIGTVLAFADNVDPNKTYTSQTWVRFAKGKTLVGVDESDSTFASVGKTGGEKTHTLSSSEMPRHTHSIGTGSLHGSVNGGGTSRTRFAKGTSGGYAFQNGTQSHLTFVYSLGAAGENASHNNLQPYETVFYWKRTA